MVKEHWLVVKWPQLIPALQFPSLILSLFKVAVSFIYLFKGAISNNVSKKNKNKIINGMCRNNRFDVKDVCVIVLQRYLLK